jgi:hypothetical protein
MIHKKTHIILFFTFSFLFTYLNAQKVESEAKTKCFNFKTL